MITSNPTPDQELNGVLRELVTSAQAILGDNFVAAYLQGSFAVGDWDVDSDVDWVIAIERDISDTELPALQTMHARLYRLDAHWAQHLEGSYIPRAILRRRGPERHQLLFLNNTDDTLERSDHDDTAIVRWVTREYGIALAGPPPATLIEPVSADELRREALSTMRDWADAIHAGQYRMDNRWAQPFVTLSYCRMLHTLQTGRVASKLASAQWASQALASQWAPLIQRAWDERPNPSLKVRQPADQQVQQATLAFIQYALALSGQRTEP
ncbi:MAG TPA: aminoglycoside adenylyltransferase domain-containing protein [Ktedonobacterales bacterium]|nr:aminoglycoside adenylyltransferase domain-containing protein [Ktedonobacterales bacterium]